MKTSQAEDILLKRLYELGLRSGSALHDVVGLGSQLNIEAALIWRAAEALSDRRLISFQGGADQTIGYAKILPRGVELV
jgi:hypothetical protein